VKLREKSMRSGKDKRVIKRFRSAVFERFPRKERKALWKRIETNTGITTGRRMKVSLIIFKAAASIALLFALSYFAKEMIQKQHIVEIAEVKHIAVETGNMERVRLILPDSSVVWLNAGSRLEYPETFDSREREIKLSGEAFFDVRKEEDGRKFVVLAGNLAVNVLGTQFTVVNYPNEKLAEVVLASGKVSIQGADEENSEFKLLPGERFSFHKTTHQRIIEKTDISLYTNWLDGKLVFNNAELGYILKNLERWYGITFECPEYMKTRDHLTFILRNESLEQTLQMMTELAHLKFEKTATELIVMED
jgi:ferric-dicitrate binding protein FerR (iron transport regulator)